MKIGILGLGEVGQAIKQLYFNSDVYVKDLDKDTFVENMDFLHVCIPYSDTFVQTVLDTCQKYNPKYIVIHSTVRVGTTKDISKTFKNVAYSPVRGVHPNLLDGLKIFVKFVGSYDEDVVSIITQHFSRYGIKTYPSFNPSALELAKLLDTTYYGICIAFHDYANKLCQELDVDFDLTMTKFNETYNKGYKELDKENVIRPVLYPPEGQIGGHCVIPNAKILKEQFGDHLILESILNVK